MAIVTDMTSRKIASAPLFLRAFTIISLLSLVVPATARAQEEIVFDGPLRVVRSDQPLPTVPDGVPGRMYEPIAGTVLPAGASCIAWNDSRQGGVIMAARVSASGAVLDSMGIPVAWGESPQLITVLPSDGGCTVAYLESRWSESDLVGVEISWPEPVVIPRERFRLTSSSASHHYADDTTLLIFSRDGANTVVRAVDPDGSIRTGSTPVALNVRSVTTVGGVHYLIGYLGNKPSLWRVEPGLTLERIPTEVIPENSFLQLFPDGSHQLLLTAKRGNHLEVLRYALDGTIMEWRDTTAPGSVVGMIEEGGTQLLFLRAHPSSTDPGTIIVDLVESLEPVGSLPRQMVHMKERSGTRLYLYQEPGPGAAELTFELTRTGPSGNGSPLTATPDPEIVVDVASEGNDVALLWSELGSDGTRLRLGLTHADRLGQIFPIEVGPVDHYTTAAVAIRNGITMVVWVDDDTLWYRRVDRARGWIETPRLLSTGRLTLGPQSMLHGIGPGSLIATEEGFVVVWSDLETRRLHQATILDSGERVERELAVEPVTPANVTVARWGSGFVVAGVHAFPPLCEICTCVPSPHMVVTMLYDEEWSSAEPLITNQHDLPWTYFGLDLIEKEDTLLLVTDGIVTMIGHDASGTRTLTTFETRLDRATGLWLDDRIVIVGRHWRGYATAAMIHAPGSGAGVPFGLVPDFSQGWSLPYQPRLLWAGNRLWLFGSEVSANPAEGTVRRLRFHELAFGPPHERRRPVRR